LGGGFLPPELPKPLIDQGSLRQQSHQADCYESPSSPGLHHALNHPVPGIALAHFWHNFRPETPRSTLSLLNKYLISNGAGRGDRTSMSLRSKVFEFLLRLAPSVTIGHVWSIFSNLDTSTSWLIWHMVPSGSSWCWHKIETLDARLAVSATLAHPLPFG
jgi:hypothetical protein